MSDCFCIRGKFDFYIKVIDTQTIVYNDLSKWMDEEPYIIPSNYTVSVKLPSGALLDVQVKPLTTTILKASELGISKFKDGIYCFTIDPLSEESGGCGRQYTKSVGIFPNIECCLDSAFSKLEEDHEYNGLKDVEMWLLRAKNSSELEMENQALQEYTIAKRKLSKLDCGCHC